MTKGLLTHTETQLLLQTMKGPRAQCVVCTARVGAWGAGLRRGALQPQAKVTRVGGEQGGRGRGTRCWEVGGEAARDLGVEGEPQCSRVTVGTGFAKQPRQTLSLHLKC